jgi:hypothetical protein
LFLQYFVPNTTPNINQVNTEKSKRISCYIFGLYAGNPGFESRWDHQNKFRRLTKISCLLIISKVLIPQTPIRNLQF